MMSVDINPTALTVSFWVKPHVYNSILFSKMASSPQYSYYIQLTSAGKILSYLSQNGSSSIIDTTTSNLAIPLDIFTHVVLTWSTSNNTSLYFNGVKQNTSVSNNITGLNSNSANLVIGKYYNNTSFFNGIIDEARIYNRALSAGEITTQYNNQNSPSTFYSLGSESLTEFLALDHLAITGTGSMTAGASQVITITAKTILGATYTSYTGDKSLIFSGASISGGGNNPTCSDKTSADVNFGTGTTITFASGVATCTLKLYKAETAAINTTDGTETATGYTLSVAVSSPLSDASIQINGNGAYTTSKTFIVNKISDSDNSKYIYHLFLYFAFR
jgi:hypothetical protein